ncbi:MAG: 50S ribosomal protein L35 [Mycoplasma sp.]|nr:50S ribosomal protein L35 [Mycoplasma sp.]
MQKFKPKKSLQKRIKVLSSGKIKRGNAFRSHLAQNKSTKQKRQSRKASLMHPSDYKRFKSII